jgi:hypothetical protein
VAELARGAARRAIARAGVGLVLAPPLAEARAPRGARVVFADATATVYELGGAWPRAGLLASPGGSRRLITTLCDDGGWRVLAAGRPVVTGRDDGAFLGARLRDAGEVHLLQRPRGLLAGSLGGAVGAALLLLLALPPGRLVDPMRNAVP